MRWGEVRANHRQKVILKPGWRLKCSPGKDKKQIERVEEEEVEMEKCCSRRKDQERRRGGWGRGEVWWWRRGDLREEAGGGHEGRGKRIC